MENKAKFIFAILIFLLLSSLPIFAEEEVKIEIDKYPNLKAAVEKSDMKDKFMEALKDAGKNWESLAVTVESLTGQKQDDMIWLITVMPHLDRLEATKDILLEHLEYAYKAKDELPYKISEDMFRPYILVYRIGDEPVRPWRKLLYERFKDLVGRTPTDTAKNVNKWVFENVKLRERGFFGPRPSPDQIIKNGLGIKEDISTLTTAILKTLGVPSRSARCEYFGEQKEGAAWVEIYDGSDWIPLYPDSPENFGDFTRWEKEYSHNITAVLTTSAFDAVLVTDKYTDTGIIEFSFIRHGVLQENFEHFGIAVFNNGAWSPMDDLSVDFEKAKESNPKLTKFDITLGDGKYLVEAGVRNRNGDVHMYTEEVMITPDIRIPLEIKLDPPIEKLSREELIIRELEELPSWEIPLYNADGSIFSDIVYKSNFAVLAIFDLINEPSKRMIPTLVDLKLGKTKIQVYGIYAGPPNDEELRSFIKENSIDFLIGIDNDGKSIEKYGLTRKKDDEKHFTRLPSIILFNRGEIVLWVEGYDLGIRDFIIDMVRYQESLPW